MIRATRVVEPELMDQPELDVRRHRHALDALGRVNRVSRTAASLWPAIRDASNCAAGPLRVLDLASGGGHVLVALARRSARKGLEIQWTGWDVSPVAIDYARSLASRAGLKSLRFERADALRAPMPEGFDVILCTLFLHHLSGADATGLLRRMSAAARQMIVVSDLRRTWRGFLLTWIGCQLLSRSSVFHFDAARSVEAAFTTEEVRELAPRAQLTGAQITQTWPQRWLLLWRRPTV